MVSYSTAERNCALYLSDFVTFEGDRYYVSADLRSGKIKLERFSNAAIEQFLRNVLSIGEDGTLPSGGVVAASEVSA